MLEQILTEYPAIEAVQLQFNYADYDDPKVQSRKCYEVCVKHGKPVIVMEPVKGGNLVNLPESAKAELDALRGGKRGELRDSLCGGFPRRDDGASGMSNMEQMRDNLSFMRDFRPLDEREKGRYRLRSGDFKRRELIPCTGYRYCVDGCRSTSPSGAVRGDETTGRCTPTETPITRRTPRPDAGRRTA